uniref:Uncharacterized protein n=1 Tax=viral metagenome TaxID=1070528 RepID=A0A6C0JUG8_9ZZZZ
MLRYVSSLFTTTGNKTNKPQLQQLLKMLWLCDKPETVLATIEKLTKTDDTVPKLFLQQFKYTTPNTVCIIKGLLETYYAAKYEVCSTAAEMLVEDTILGSYIALAIGTEGNKHNKDFYHKIRVLKKMEMGPWRKFLGSCKNEKTNSIFNTDNKEISSFTLGLFNEPFASRESPVYNKTVSNPSRVNDILSLYKGTIYKNKILRTPIEVSLDKPLEQKDIHGFIRGLASDEPLVIVCKKIDRDVSPPGNVFIIYLEDTESIHNNIFPFINNLVIVNLIDVLKML